jgi:hypothetical protein
MNLFEGKIGPVPEVDPEDLIAVYRLYKEAQREVSGHFSLSFRLISHACKPGSDVHAVIFRVFRIMGMEAVSHLLPEEAQIRTDEESLKQAASEPLDWSLFSSPKK